MSAADVVKKARSEGVKLSPAQVSVARSLAAKHKAKPKAGAWRQKRSAPAPRSAGGLHDAIRKLVWEHGLTAVEAATASLKRSVGL
jgi:hypothetical protein